MHFEFSYCYLKYTSFVQYIHNKFCLENWFCCCIRFALKSVLVYWTTNSRELVHAPTSIKGAHPCTYINHGSSSMHTHQCIQNTSVVSAAAEIQPKWSTRPFSSVVEYIYSAGVVACLKPYCTLLYSGEWIQENLSFCNSKKLHFIDFWSSLTKFMVTGPTRRSSSACISEPNSTQSYFPYSAVLFCVSREITVLCLNVVAPSHP